MRDARTVSSHIGYYICVSLGSVSPLGRLTASLHSVSLDQAGPLAAGIGSVTVPFRFLTVGKSHHFPTKKPPGTQKASDGRPLDGYTVRGLVKTDWLTKHVNQVGVDQPFSLACSSHLCNPLPLDPAG